MSNLHVFTCIKVMQQEQRQQEAGENFRRRRFPYRPRPPSPSFFPPSRSIEIFNLTLRLRRDTLPFSLSPMEGLEKSHRRAVSPRWNDRPENRTIEI
ncbi:hypothetical protein PUN28_004101 [Cardiocondyla obscurior]|uniref:Uncharacterized protein n=1 Tax=Cardiocondyla obscurior TaxID=286306 RepID=A0AAW2GPK4_9HYME